MTSLRSVSVPVAPGGSAPGGQRVVVLPRVRVALSIGLDRKRYDPIAKGLAALCEVVYVVRQLAGESEVHTERVADVDPIVTVDFVVRDETVTSVELVVEVVGRHASSFADDARPTMLRAVQSFTVRDAKLAAAAERSPLVEVTAEPFGVTATVQLEVLDYTAYWFGQCIVRAETQKDGTTQERHTARSFIATRQQELEGDGASMTLRVLLHLAKAPMLWTASVPEVTAGSSKAAVSTYLFFLPHHEAWGGSVFPPEAPRADGVAWPSPAQRWVNPFRPSRYLLADPLGYVDVQTNARGVVEHQWILRVGLERALRQSGKPAVMFVSISNLNLHGAAVTRALPTLITRALRLLASMGHVARDRPKEDPVTLGRLALGGFSDGASHLASAFEANTTVTTVTEEGQTRTTVRSAVQEVYLHDPRGDWPGFVPKTWFAWLAEPGHKLRMTRQQARPTQALVDAARRAGRVEGRDWSAYIRDPAKLVEELDANERWRFVMKEYNYRGRNTTSRYSPLAPVYDHHGHQFMMHGAPPDAPEGESFTSEFLKNSDL